MGNAWDAGGDILGGAPPQDQPSIGGRQPEIGRELDMQLLGAVWSVPILRGNLGTSRSMGGEKKQRGGKNRATRQDVGITGTV
ncbi:MAG: hypothetical protein B7Z80_20555 [Rhodospirillales bacterium 20-64-7]|nr:MAG: hypothetical protein B7Z80_20555 [Rhodospirillales bacterium 20-64-7]